MVRLLTFLITLISLNFPPMAWGEYDSKLALISHIHAAGFDHVIEISVKGHDFTNYFTENGRLFYRQSFRAYRDKYGSLQTPALDYKDQDATRAHRTAHAYKVGDSFICFTHSLDERTFTQRWFDVEPFAADFRSCLIIPTGVDRVIEALSRAPLDSFSAQ